MSTEYRNLLVEAFPEPTWPILTRGIREAIKIADGVRLSTPFLTTLVGRDLRGLMRRAALMWRILFRDGKLVPLHVALSSVSRLYGWLMWGATPRGELTHFALGMPEHKDNKWLTYVDVLTHVTAEEAKSGATREEAPSKPNPALMLKFREEIARSLGQDNLDQDIAGNDG